MKISYTKFPLLQGSWLVHSVQKRIAENTQEQRKAQVEWAEIGSEPAFRPRSRVSSGEKW